MSVHSLSLRRCPVRRAGIQQFVPMSASSPSVGEMAAGRLFQKRHRTVDESYCFGLPSASAIDTDQVLASTG